jgi:hypothetical protein
MTTIYVETYEEQESYWERLATNMAIIGIRETLNEVYTAIYTDTNEDSIQWNEHYAAWLEYQQWCLLNDLPYAICYPYGE